MDDTSEFPLRLYRLLETSVLVQENNGETPTYRPHCVLSNDYGSGICIPSIIINSFDSEASIDVDLGFSPVFMI